VRGTRVQGELSKGVSRGVIKGTRQGVAPCALILSTCTYVSCYCVNVANKRIVFRL
jgi:hypothetical protein